ncbi:uncharacterized protein LOC126569698 [Anopheles aquasalis]|uniref:uncharacterized protein LOC126569698 n=1 Tax=Anopheles aquasalis TaxID=42839 RepID=UPI00215B6A89|nr:uncharacterized protein LOC126569698 [Anopheles aquasalis]
MQPALPILFVFLTLHPMGIWSEASGMLHLDDHPGMSALVEKGKKQLESLREKTNLPQYGECWMRSLDFLQHGCRVLSDTVQVDIALRFTDCFMEMSGQENSLHCATERTEPLKKLCMSEMTDRAFAVYTEFFTQTQNMCYFLQNQNWHRQTERTIDRLGVFSRAAGERLELVNTMQDTLLTQQRLQHTLQRELLMIGHNLSFSLNGSHETLNRLTENLQESTARHSLVLEELFREFHQLHRWIVGRYAFVDGLLFYGCYLVILLIFTSLHRTAHARAMLLVLFFASVASEWALYKQSTIQDSVILDYYRWMIRQLAVGSSVVTLLYSAYCYEDIPRNILVEIREQNRQILGKIEQLNPKAFDDSKLHKFSVSYATKHLKLPLVEEQPHYEYQHERDQRSFSRISRSSTPTEQPIPRTESSELRISRYNLRRKSVVP